MSNLKTYIDNLQEEFDQVTIDITYSKRTNSEKLLYLYAYYHYFNADNSKIDEILAGDIYQWDSSDHISGIYLDEDSDNRDVDALISLYSDTNDFDIPQNVKAMLDAEYALIDAREKKKTSRKELISILSEEDYKFGSQKPLKIRIITNYQPKSAVQKKSVLNAINALKPENDFISFDIKFAADIEYEVLEIENPREYVESGSIRIDKKNNYTLFGKENSLIVNASALSVKKLYELYSYRGLFAQNLRYYVKNVNIDQNIIQSIQDNFERFWYYNNGIIVICDDYSVNGRVVNLKKFSIINGGQTTKLIGETEFENDFYLQCKIIKNRYQDEDDKIQFIASVAEASNTQKPIKSKDLIANKPEQRLLKKRLADAGIYCQIKRGEKVNKKLYPNAWQNTTNEELGQFLLSFLYQKPGAARGNKQSICGNAERYSLIFGKQYDTGMLSDLLRIKAQYKQWMTYVKKTNDDVDPYRLGLVNNSMFFTTAIIGVIAKIIYHDNYISAINASTMTEQKMEVVSQFDINHHIFAVQQDYKKKLFELFEYIYKYFLRPAYEMFRQYKNSNQFSNFTKYDSSYQNFVFRQISFRYENGIPEHDMQIMDSIMYKPSDDEKSADNDLLSKYINLVYTDMPANNQLSQEQINSIKDALIDYRTKTYKKNRIKAYEVFKNASADRIAKFAPTSKEDLEQLRCLDKSQLDLYAEDIIAIVNEVLQSGQNNTNII